MSTEFCFPSRTSQRWLRVGPLADDRDRFAARLAAQGYARRSAASKLRLVRNLSRWLERQGLGVEALDEPRIEAFLLTRGPRCVHSGDAATTRQLLSHLRAGGRIPLAAPSPQNPDPFAPVEHRYESFLVNERGVSRATVKSYLPIIRAFLAECFAARDMALETITIRDVNQFITRQSRRLSRSRVKLLVTASRRTSRSCPGENPILPATFATVQPCCLRSPNSRSGSFCRHRRRATFSIRLSSRPFFSERSATAARISVCPCFPCASSRP